MGKAGDANGENRGGGGGGMHRRLLETIVLLYLLCREDPPDPEKRSSLRSICLWFGVSRPYELLLSSDVDSKVGLAELSTMERFDFCFPITETVSDIACTIERSVG